MPFLEKLDPADALALAILIIVETVLFAPVDVEIKKSVIQMGLGGIIGYLARGAVKGEAL